MHEKQDAITGMIILKQTPLPEDILTLGVEGINKILRDVKFRAVGRNRAQTLISAAEYSVGDKEGSISARMEIRMLFENYEFRDVQLQKAMTLIEELVKKIPMAEKLLKIKGARITVSEFRQETVKNWTC